jgi:excisionase family DNA binding protein
MPAINVMTTEEVAQHLRIHRITLYRLLKAGQPLGQIKIGRLWRFNRDYVERYGEKTDWRT